MNLLWKLIIASVAMLVLGYIGEAFHQNETQSWIWGALSGAAYFYIVWLVVAGDVAKLANGAGGQVAKANGMLAKFVIIGWAIYPIGYFLGYLAGGTDVGTLNIVYNLADVLNKIAFGLFIWYAANEDTSSSH